MSPGSFGGPALLSLLREEDVARSTGKLPLNHCCSPGGLPHATTPGFFSLCTSCSHRSSSIPEQAWFSHRVLCTILNVLCHDCREGPLCSICPSQCYSVNRNLSLRAPSLYKPCNEKDTGTFGLMPREALILSEGAC